jgi:SAM-dependent methyltransferase
MYGPPIQELIDLQVIDPASVTRYYPRVRDRDDVGVLRCTKSGVIFLDRTDHIELPHYETMSGASYWGVDTREKALQETHEDDARRATALMDLYGSQLSRIKYVDIGCGTGGTMEILKDKMVSISGVEPQTDVRVLLENSGFVMYKTPNELPKETFELTTLFHVLEHILNPLETFQQVRDAMLPGAKLIIEVPHARDVLLSTFELDSFKKFTFWSEHLVLHTRESLKKILEVAGFNNIEMQGLQRYPLANHLNWLWKGEPGGQKKLSQFRNAALEKEYAALLDSLDKTDTLWAVATK